MKSPVAQRLGRWLPDHLERDLYRPSIADLERERIGHAESSLRHTFRVIAVWIECLRAKHLWRLTPIMGRPFHADDVRENAPPVAIVSYELWRSELGSDPHVLSRSLQFGATRRMVVGVAPPEFRFPPGQRTDVMVLVQTADRPAGQPKSRMDFRAWPAASV